MAAFALSQTFLQDSAGTTATYTDTTFTDGQENPSSFARGDFVRTAVLTDSYGTILETNVLPATVDGDTFDYALTADQSINVALTYEGSTDYSLTTVYPFDRITNLKYKEKINPASCCTSKAEFENRVNVLLFAKGAEYTELTTDQVSFDLYITAENSYLDLL